MTRQPATEPNTPPGAFARAAADYSPLPMLALDAGGLVRYANRAAQTLLCPPGKRLDGVAFLDLLDVGSRAKGAALLLAALAGPTDGFELAMPGVDSQEQVVAWRAVPLAAADGLDGSILLYGEPMAATIAATERQIALNRRLGALFRIASATAGSLELDELMRQTLRVALEELDLRSGAILLSAAPQTSDSSAEPPLRLAAQTGCSPALLRHLADPHRAAAAWGARALPGGVFVVEDGAIDVDLDDNTGWVAAPLNLAALPLAHEQQVLGWLYVLTDRYRAFRPDEVETLRAITNLLGPPLVNARLYNALHETSGQLQAVLDSIDSGVLLVDQDGLVRYANARLGVLLDTDVRSWPGQPRASVFTAPLLAVEPAPAAIGGELWELAGRAPMVLRRLTTPVHDEQGAPLGTAEIYSDITAIQHMNRLKDEFIAAAAHDLKTPVTAIKGYAQIALRMARRLEDPRMAQQLAMINARSDELTHLMESILDVSRIQSGRMSLELSRFSLADLADAVLLFFDFDLRRQGRTINVRLEDPAAEVVWDRQRIIRVLTNLVGNALKYSPSGGLVELSAALLSGPEGEQVELCVTDSGIGIPEEERGRIFDRFYRVPQTIADGFKGTGLGLYISRHIVEAHRGEIWAANAEHGGRGTTLHVVLPRVFEEG
ncbi:MAG TPA: ATP-binding protein [Roseiflexaceae bacterium]|nr:ATP-binding protein [Roseiflexaceae bacterium]